MTLRWTKGDGKVARVRADYVKQLKGIVSQETDAFFDGKGIRRVFPPSLAAHSVTLYMAHIVQEADRTIERTLSARATEEDIESYFLELRSKAVGMLADRVDQTVSNLRKMFGEMKDGSEGATEDHREDGSGQGDPNSNTVLDVQPNL